MDNKNKQEALAKLLEKHGKEYAKLLGTKNIAFAVFHRTNDEDSPAVHIYNHDKKLTTEKLAISWFEITGRLYDNIIIQNYKAAVEKETKKE